MHKINMLIIQVDKYFYLEDELYNFQKNVPTLNKKKGSKLKLLFVGMINKDKGIIELLNAITVFSNLELHLEICGLVTDETIRKQYEELISINKDKVTFNGYVSGKQKEQLFRNADMLILPSYHEGMPLVILEALSYGCGIMSTSVGAIPEILNEDNYYRLKIGSIDGIRQGLYYFLSNPKALELMKEKNVELAKNFSIECHVKQFLNFISK